MSEQRSERVIEGEARAEWGRLPVAAVVVVSFLLAALIGMTSADSPWLPGDGSRSSSPTIVGEVLAVALAAGLCILLALIWVHTSRRRREKRPDGSPIATDGLGSSVRAGSVVLVGGTLAVVALVIVFWFLLQQADSAQPPPPPSVSTIRDVTALPPSEPLPSASPVFNWFLIGLAASIAVVVPLALIARRRRQMTDGPQPEDGEVPESVARAVGESIDQIERDPDARRAIIRAYAQMEHAFDDAGVPRRPYEAPFEYLGRALRGVRVSAPAAGRLAGLFERARFSQHVVDAETKDDAIGALREIERQLQAPSP
jgi:hypothetical protein